MRYWLLEANCDRHKHRHTHRRTDTVGSRDAYTSKNRLNIESKSQILLFATSSNLSKICEKIYFKLEMQAKFNMFFLHIF